MEFGAGMIIKTAFKPMGVQSVRFNTGAQLNQYNPKYCHRLNLKHRDINTALEVQAFMH
jgi:hypothetical protein